MNNCLVTKLKSIVNNDELFTLNEYKFYLPKDAKVSINRFSSGNMPIKVSNGTLISNGVDTGSMTGDVETLENPFSCTENCYISFEPKSNIKVLTLFDTNGNIGNIDYLNVANLNFQNCAFGDFNLIKHCDNLESIAIQQPHDTTQINFQNNIFPKINSLDFIISSPINITDVLNACPNLENYYESHYDNNNLYGNISAFENNTKIKIIYCVTGISLTGDISSLSNCTSLTMLKFISSDCTINGNFSSIKSLVTEHDLREIALPTNVKITQADKDEAIAAGCSIEGGTIVENY